MLIRLLLWNTHRAIMRMRPTRIGKPKAINLLALFKERLIFESITSSFLRSLHYEPCPTIATRLFNTRSRKAACLRTTINSSINVTEANISDY